MRMTLRRLREAKGWKLETAAKLYHMDVERLRSYENYVIMPTFEEVAMMLNMLGYYWEDAKMLIWQDLHDHSINSTEEIIHSMLTGIAKYYELRGADSDED